MTLVYGKKRKALTLKKKHKSTPVHQNKRSEPQKKSTTVLLKALTTIPEVVCYQMPTSRVKIKLFMTFEIAAKLQNACYTRRS